MTEQALPRAPSGLGRAGRRLWKSVVDDANGQDIELDALEKSYLEDACRLTDRIDELEATLATSETGLMVKGYQGQPVAHPLLGEIRQSRQLRALTLARIRVTGPEDKSAGNVMQIGVQQREAALKRWRA